MSAKRQRPGRTVRPKRWPCSARDRGWRIAEKVAKNLNCPPGTLEWFIAQDSYSTDSKTAAAANPNCPPRSLASAAASSHAVVRAAAATNPNSRPDDMARLASDRDVLVRASVAARPDTTAEQLTEFAADQSEDVRARRRRKPGLPAGCACEAGIGQRRDSARIGSGAHAQKPVGVEASHC